MLTRRVGRQDRAGSHASGAAGLPARRCLQRLRMNGATKPPQRVDPEPAATNGKINADTLVALRVSALAQNFPALGTQLRLALYLDRAALLLFIAAVLDAYLAESTNAGQRRERRDVQPVLIHLQHLLAEPWEKATLSQPSR